MSTSSREFSLYHSEPGRRRWLGPTATSLVLYAAIAVGLLLIPRQLIRIHERQVDVTLVDKLDFVQRVAKPETPQPPPAPVLMPPASPPPKPIPKVEPPPKPKAPPAAAAPIVRPDQKVRRLDQPPPPKEFRAPREIPKEAPKEADPSQDKGVAVYGDAGTGDAAGLEGGASGGVAGGMVGGAMDPNAADPPRMLASNSAPVYPPEARAAGRTGTVVLKVVVYADGTVGDIHVVEGEEPFVRAAVQAVKSWRYEPARLKGQPVAVYREIRIPFKLSG